jgi:putative oxidoreductase
MKSNKKFQDTSLLILRIIIAIIFLFAAYAKYGYLSAGAPGSSPGMIKLLWFLTVVEPLGAIALIIGFLTQWAATGLAIIMVGAIYTLKFTMGIALFTQPGAVGWDYNLLILGSCLILIAFGAGKYAVDARKK